MLILTDDVDYLEKELDGAGRNYLIKDA